MRMGYSSLKARKTCWSMPMLQAATYDYDYLLDLPKAHFPTMRMTRTIHMTQKNPYNAFHSPSWTRKSENAYKSTELSSLNSTFHLPRFLIHTYIYIYQMHFRDLIIQNPLAGRVLDPPPIFPSKMHIASRCLPPPQILRLYNARYQYRVRI